MIRLVQRSLDRRLTKLSDLLELSPAEFESWCAVLLERSGYGQATVTEKGPKGGDGGVDLNVNDPDGHIVCVGQCKRWTKRPASGLMRVIRELAGSMSRCRITRGLFLITVPATQFEKQEAKLLGITVMDAGVLTRLMDDAVQCPEANSAGSPTHVAFGRAGRKIPNRFYRIAPWFVGIVATVFALIMLYHYHQVILGIIGIGILAVVDDITPRQRWRRQYRPRKRWRSRRRW